MSGGKGEEGGGKAWIWACNDESLHGSVGREGRKKKKIKKSEKGRKAHGERRLRDLVGSNAAAPDRSGGKGKNPRKKRKGTHTSNNNKRIPPLIRRLHTAPPKIKKQKKEKKTEEKGGGKNTRLASVRILKSSQAEREREKGRKKEERRKGSRARPTPKKKKRATKRDPSTSRTKIIVAKQAERKGILGKEKKRPKQQHQHAKLFSFSPQSRLGRKGGGKRKERRLKGGINARLLISKPNANKEEG